MSTGLERRPERADAAGSGGLLERIVTWAAQVVGTEHGYICLVEPEGTAMALRVGIGAYAGLVGVRMLRGEGLSGRVWVSGQPLAVSDYSRWDGRVRRPEAQAFHAVLGVPLVSGCVVTGVIGLGSSDPGRTFTDDEVEQVSHFAELASVALDNADLYAAAQGQLAERARVEEELRTAEQRLRTLIDQLPALVYSEEFAIGGSRLLANRRVESMFGFTPEESGQKNFWKTRLHPDDRERVLAEEARCEQSGEPFCMEYRAFHRNGEVRWVRDECVLVHDEAGRPRFWQGLVVDITDAKRAEQATKDALLREQQAAARLRALDELKNTFLDAVSHELRTPLAAVIGIALTLQRAEGELSEADRADLVARLVANGRKLDRLLSDLLDLDRLSRGIVTPKREPTDMAELAGRIAEEWRLLNGRELQVDVEPVTVSVDPNKVERIVENLLANAARHTPPETPVWLRVHPTGGGVTLAVEDAGAGVPPEVRATVFEPFRRGPDAPVHAPGVGIGLSLVARFAELHGGRAWVEERDGGGSAFRVFLPDGPTAPAER
jgi:PAS domain S-box-containing protein